MSRTHRKRQDEDEDDLGQIDEPPVRDLIEDRGTPEYRLGVLAYKEGYGIHSVPYRIGFTFGDKRRRWYVGWLDQRSRESLEELFVLHGIAEYP